MSPRVLAWRGGCKGEGGSVGGPSPSATHSAPQVCFHMCGFTMGKPCCLEKNHGVCRPESRTHPCARWDCVEGRAQAPAALQSRTEPQAAAPWSSQRCRVMTSSTGYGDRADGGRVGPRTGRAWGHRLGGALNRGAVRGQGAVGTRVTCSGTVVQIPARRVT